MEKLLFTVSFLLLLSLACGGSAAVWQPASRSAPQFEAATPKLFLWDRVSLHTVNVHDLASGEMTRETGQLATEITAVVSAEYQVVGPYVMQRQGSYFTNPGGHTSPNGLWLAYEDANHFSLRRTDGAGMLTLSAAGRWFYPVWSPDSQWLAYADSQVWAVAMGDLSQRPLLNRFMEPLAWSADNQHLLLRDGSDLVILNVAAQTERTVAGVDAAEIRGQPAWSPDGQTIYAAYGENGRSEYDKTFLPRLHEIPLARLVAIATAGGRNAIRDLLPAAKDQGITRFILSPDGQAIVADHVFCSKRASGLIPLLSTWGCDQSQLVVETAGGAYMTIQTSPEREMAWERPWPPVNLADLPLPPEPIPAPPEEVVNTPPSLSAPPSTPAPPQVVPFGETAVNDAWAVTLLKLVRGDAAWEQIETAVHITPPPAGQEYLLARARLQYSGGDESSPTIARTNFELIDAEGNALERVTAVPPPPALDLFITLAPDETHEGWIIFMVPVEADVTLRLRTGFGRHDFLYLALPENKDE